MRRLAALLTASCALALAACASQPLRAPVASLPAAERERAEQAQAAREQALARDGAWSLQGRAAITRGDKGGSGRIDWRQDGGTYTLALSAPVTRQSWRLLGDETGARIEGLDGGPREGGDASRLLLEAAGLEVPVDALASWVRGARAEQGRFGPARLEFDAGHRLARLVQGGWTIDYVAWQSVQPGVPALPTRLNAERGEAQVRLIVDSWGGPGAP
jgi:outer membrane lipoprotein LolB